MYLTAVIATCVHVLKVGRTVVTQYYDSVSSLIVTFCWSLVVNEVKATGEVIPLQARCDPEGGCRYCFTLP